MERELPEGISPAPTPTGCQQLSEAFLLVSTPASRPGFLCVSFGPITKFSLSIWRRSPSPEELGCAEKNHPGFGSAQKQMRSRGLEGLGVMAAQSSRSFRREEGAQCLGEGS